MPSKLIPAEAFPPGEHLRDELTERGWTVAQLAGMMGRPSRVVSEIVEAQIEITPDLAQALSVALGTSTQLWLNLEETYRLHTRTHGT
ncbi:HigA family addiction module antitoxin [Candidatus Poriferisodalis sp.]|uniref:HigA family addiction module antitoxin n=1 Tax=Candidatus Poriferisodalis sp. TaxID=3101277 RepID=UPI003D1353D9